MITAGNGDSIGFTLPPGAVYIANFISTDEERDLVDAIDGREWNTELKRRVQHFGYRYDYRARNVGLDSFLGPLPNWLQPLCERLIGAGLFSERPDQVIVNEYQSGQGISAHVDCVPCFADHIASLSLLSQCEMIFRHRGGGETASITLEPRSLLLMSGSARYEWTHEIPARKSDTIHGLKWLRGRRISLTFRSVIPAVL
jgi:alkylated DNA repair dioxygenase AlkB